MSSIFNKNKVKRPRTSADESNNSFVRNVTSRMSGLLPASITKWFSSSSSSSANGSAPTVDASDSSTEDEAPEPQPPAKRMRFMSPGSIYSTESPIINSQETSESVPTSVLYNSIQSPPGKYIFRRETNYVSTPFQSSNDGANFERADKDMSTNHTVTTIVNSVAQKRKSIIEVAGKAEDPYRPPVETPSNPKSDIKQQTHYRPKMGGSPFYRGNTRYGGASSIYSKPKPEPIVKQPRVAFERQASRQENVNMSASARRVLDLYDGYSSPMTDAKRLQEFMKPRSRIEETDRFLSEPSFENDYRSNYLLNYKNQELHVPRIASIMTIKQRSRLMDTTKAARQIIASHSSTISNLQPYTDVSNREKVIKGNEKAQDKFTSKLKSKLTRPNRGGDGLDMPDTVKLPTAVLQIDHNNLPKFNFGETSTPKPVPISSKTISTQTLSEPDTLSVSMSSKSTATEPEPVNEMFKFSSPLELSLDSKKNNSTPPKFAFGTPPKATNKEKGGNITLKKMDTLLAKSTDAPKDKNVESASTANVPVNNISNQTEASKWKCENCWVKNDDSKAKCSCCGSEKGKSIPATPKLVAAKTVKGWKCEDCWITNDDTADRCICCRRVKPPAKVDTPEPQEMELDTIGKEWKCEDCWITNKSCVDKCAACGGAKPGTKTAEEEPLAPSPPPPVLITSSFSNPSNQLDEIVKAQKAGDKWECPTCLVGNDSDKTSCVCCGTEKSGGEKKETTKKLFNFSTDANPTFKFGLDPKVQETNIQKKLEESSKPAQKVAEVSEANNNIISETPTFTFTLPVNKSGTTVDVSKSETPTFTFGIPKLGTPSITIKPLASLQSTFTPIKIPESETTKEDEKEKLQEVPKVVFKVPKVPEPTRPKFFTPPKLLPKSTTQTITSPKFTPLVTSISDNKKEETPENTLALPSDSVQADKPPSSPFTFSASGIKPAMFSMPSTTAASVATTTSAQLGEPVQTAPVSTTAPTMSMFTKPESSNSTGLSLFQTKNDSQTSQAANIFQKPETTSAPASTATPAVPLFGFGANAQPTATSTPDKPKFNFTFGSNNTAGGSSLFKPTFGTGTESNTNTFTLASGNNLTGNNLGSGNVLGGAGNGLGGNMTGNALGGTNDMSNNEMGGSGMQTVNASATSLFGQNVQNDNTNMWSNNSSTNNVFGSNGSTNNMQKPALFTFGSSTAFNANNATPTSQQTPNLFSTNSQPTPTVFGMTPQSNSNQTSLFPNQPQNQPPTNLFGTTQPTTNPSMPATGMFGSPNVGATATFGTPNQTIAGFDTGLTTTPAPAPAFNFGAPQNTSVFGFGQTPSVQPAQTGVYNFGGGTPGSPLQLQFNMGSAPSTGTEVRRVRKAVRRNTPR